MASRAAAGDHYPLAVTEQLDGGAVEAGYDRAGRDRDQPVLTALPVAPLALAVPAPTGTEVAAAPQGGEIAAAALADDHDVAAVPAITAVRAAARDVRLASEADRTIAAPAALDVDLGLVEQHPPQSWRDLHNPTPRQRLALAVLPLGGAGDDRDRAAA